WSFGPSRNDALDGELTTRDAAIGLEIARAGGVYHARRQRRRRRLAVPAAAAALGVEIIAQRLLVEARLRLAWSVGIRGPEPRTVGGHRLVDQDDAAAFITAELEFGIGDDNAPVAADFLAERIDRAGHALEPVRDFVAENFAHPRDRDVLVVAGFGLGRRAEDRGLKFRAFDEAGRQLLAGQGAMLRVFFPRRAGEIAADHAFDRKYFGAPAQHRASGDGGAMIAQRRDLGDDGLSVGADHVMRHHALEPLEPPGADLGQHRALHRNGFGHHDVEGADAVGGHEQQAVVADGIDIADLAAPDP